MRLTTYFLEPLFGRILSPFERFLKRTTAGGVILMGATVLTLILANSAWGPFFEHVWEMPVRIGMAQRSLELSLHGLVNEGLMTLFFLLVGLELKRELLVGELSSLRDSALPVIAALGGMVVPALVYHLFNSGGPAESGWGIPMATDIAFSVGILVLLSWRIPRNLIILLTALAIADDLGAVLIIALFYTHDLSPASLAWAGGVLLILVLFNRGGIRHPLPYGVLGLLLWLSLLNSGIHPTIAGVLLAFTIPARPAFTPEEFELRLNQLQEKLRSEALESEACIHPLNCPHMATVAENLEQTASAVQPPQQRMEHALSPWVTFLIIPVFALSNTGVDFSRISLEDSLRRPVTLGIILGLVLGKFIGISGFAWLAVKTGLARLPRGVRWKHLLGMAWLGGIGFTMSLFIGRLAFDDPLLFEQARLGVLLASALSASIGLLWLYAGKGKKGSTLLPRDSLKNPVIPNSCQTCHKHKDADLAALQKQYDALSQLPKPQGRVIESISRFEVKK
jgi:NhaA family Na+:H+ antiporter